MRLARAPQPFPKHVQPPLPTSRHRKKSQVAFLFPRGQLEGNQAAVCFSLPRRLCEAVIVFDDFL